MIIKHYIVTNKDNSLLEKTIDSILSAETEHDRNVFIVSNHSQDRYEGPHPVTIIRNAMRPDFSTGHLSRNWNQALISGFVDLNSPEADLVILSQSDCTFSTGYIERIIHHHQSFDLITYGAGDTCVSYSPRAVARVGLWDERFCNTRYQEADYFLRAVMYLGTRASINDGEVNGREHNPIGDVADIICPVPAALPSQEEPDARLSQLHRQSRGFFAAKWGVDQSPGQWKDNFLDVKVRVNGAIYYPYFESGVETLAEQHYLAFFESSVAS